MRRWSLLPLLALAACAPQAQARVVAIAGGDRAATFAVVSTGSVARVELPGRARTVAVSPDGSRAWFGVGSRVVAIDLASRIAAPPIAAGGRDTVLGEDGNDLLYGGLDDDSLDGGPGDDRLNTVGGGFDVVTCGPGFDRVYADATDQVAPDCEDIHI